MKASRWNPVAVGRGLVVLGAVFLVCLLTLLALFRFTSEPVAAGQVYPWDSAGSVFVQPEDGALSCVVHTAGSAARVTVRRAPDSLIPGELVGRPPDSSVTLSCEQPVRVASGLTAQLYPASGPASSLYLFGGVIVVGAVIWFTGRRRAPRPS